MQIIIERCFKSVQALSLHHILLATAASLLVACAPTGINSLTPASRVAEVHTGDTELAPSSARLAETRLGTQWGESHVSHTRHVAGQRLSQQPVDLYTMRYAAYPYRGEALTNVLLADGRVRFSVLDGRGQTRSFVRNHTGDHLLGAVGERYQLHYESLSASESYEIVAAVDGVDVISGRPASVRYRGYLLRPRATLTIEGFRESANSVAAFRFAAAEDAYAANSQDNSVDNVGVIASAVYRVAIDPVLATPLEPAPPRPNPFPADPPGRYAEPPRYDR